MAMAHSKTARIRMWTNRAVGALVCQIGVSISSTSALVTSETATSPMRGMAIRFSESAAREIERGWRKFYRSKLVDAERSAWAVWETMRESERDQIRERERDSTITPIPPRTPQPRGSERGGAGSSVDPRCRHHHRHAMTHRHCA